MDSKKNKRVGLKYSIKATIQTNLREYGIRPCTIKLQRLEKKEIAAALIGNKKEQKTNDDHTGKDVRSRIQTRSMLKNKMEANTSEQKATKNGRKSNENQSKQNERNRKRTLQMAKNGMEASTSKQKAATNTIDQEANESQTKKIERNRIRLPRSKKEMQANTNEQKTIQVPITNFLKRKSDSGLNVHVKRRKLATGDTIMDQKVDKNAKPTVRNVNADRLVTDNQVAVVNVTRDNRPKTPSNVVAKVSFAVGDIVWAKIKGWLNYFN